MRHPFKGDGGEVNLALLQHNLSSACRWSLRGLFNWLMIDDRTMAALGRIEAALKRLDAAEANLPDGAGDGSGVEITALRAESDRLRSAITATVGDIDRLLAAADGR